MGRGNSYSIPPKSVGVPDCPQSCAVWFPSLRSGTQHRRPEPSLRLPPMSEAPHSAPTDPHPHQAAEIALPEVKMHLYKPTDPVPVKIVKSEICTARKAAAF